MTEVPCPTCGHGFTPKKIGAHVRKFCSVPCKRKFEKHARKVGEAAIAAMGAAQSSRATADQDEKAVA